MAKFKLEDHFRYSSVSPQSLQQGQLLSFSYTSPQGVTDKKPLVYIHEKRIDRFYGMNLHYDMTHFTEILTRQNQMINEFLEKEFRKNQEYREKLIKEHQNKFDRSLVTEEDYKKWMNFYPKRNFEQFVIQNVDMQFMRQYRYDRMTSVTKLIFKTPQ